MPDLASLAAGLLRMCAGYAQKNGDSRMTVTVDLLTTDRCYQRPRPRPPWPPRPPRDGPPAL